MIIGTVVLLAVCMLYCVVAVAVPRGWSGGPMGYVVEACVGTNALARFQVGVTWISPYMSTLPPVFLQNQACATVPWLPFLPQRGGFAFP